MNSSAWEPVQFSRRDISLHFMGAAHSVSPTGYGDLCPVTIWRFNESVLCCPFRSPAVCCTPEHGFSLAPPFSRIPPNFHLLRPVFTTQKQTPPLTTHLYHTKHRSTPLPQDIFTTQKRPTWTPSHETSLRHKRGPRGPPPTRHLYDTKEAHVVACSFCAT
jgi:hypothetical protein